MALIEGSAHHWVAARTDASQASVTLGAEVTIVAGCSVGGRRVRTLTGDGIAHSRHVTLIDGRADEWIRTGADACFTGIGERAEVAVIARCSVGGRRIGANTARRITHAGNVTLVESRADHCIGSGAYAGCAGVNRRAEITVIARRPGWLGRIGASACCTMTHAGIVALVERSTDNRIGTGAGTTQTGVGLGAEVAVVAGSAVCRRRVRAEPSCRVAFTG